ncbi:MAG: type 4 prepilin-like protein leader peptide processing enzyme, partial [Deltaproteobacteria bacterium]|nr:type 4 prepilin-like protein leader peptide processing enzyme [Deltaproteobacteria bacterium]
MDLFWKVFFFIVGAAIGSFLNVCIWRLPQEKSIVFPASHCPQCGHAIRYSDNIPILSYLILKGKCRDCGGRISAQYPLVEAIT